MRIIVFIALLLSGSSVWSQQLAQYSQWAFHQFSFNPAHAGIQPCVDIHTLYRLQWVGFEGAPQSGFGTISIPVTQLRKKFLNTRHGLGARFETDKLGNFSTNRINLAYAAHFNFNQNDRLSMGIYGGVVQFSFDPTKAVTIDSDPSVLRQANIVKPDFTAGFWYNSTYYYTGLTIQNVTRSLWDDLGTTSRHRFHVNLNGGVKFKMGERNSLLPHAIVRIPPKGPMSIDLNLHLDFNNQFTLGLGYRNTDALIAFASLKFQERFMVVYSFDYTLSGIQKVAANTHELSLKFSTCKTRKEGSTGCPLFQ